MARRIIHLALFKEDQVDETAEALEALRGMGIVDQDISVISGTPFSEKMLGRPMSWTRVPLIGVAGAVVGFVAGLRSTWYAAALSHPRGRDPANDPDFVHHLFRADHAGPADRHFPGRVHRMISPSFGPPGYDPRITDGHIGVLFWAPPELDPKLHEALSGLGAEIIHGAETKKLWLF